jgi:hypothetical protein
MMHTRAVTKRPARAEREPGPLERVFINASIWLERAKTQKAL